MDLLARLFTGGDLSAGAPGPTDDYWYHAVGTMTAAGIPVDKDQAQKLSAWYRGRNILATTLAMLPLQLYERTADGAELARAHPLYDVLHDQPNGWQDSFVWRREKMFHLIDDGWAYDWMVGGPRGFADELQPIEPTDVTPAQIKSGPNKGRYVFHVRDAETGRSTPHTQDEIFYLRGAGGKGILEYARSSLGTALATDSYAARIFSKGTLNGGIIENPGTLDPDASKRMAQSMTTAVGEWHLPFVMEQGSKFIPNTLTPENAQMLLSRQFTVDDIARWLGIPRMMLESSDPSFGNAEQFGKQFITINMGGWLSLWEFGINGQLVLNRQRFYAQLNRDAFERGDLSTRWLAHVNAVNAGIKSVDEVRSVENLNRRGGKADELREPQNITGKPLEPAPNPTLAPFPPRKKPDEGGKATAIAQASASRLLRKEIAAVQKMGVRYAADADGFAVAVAAFYAGHAELVEQTLLMATADARGYCAGQAAQIVGADWLSALANWKTDDYAAGLAGLALDDAA